MSVLQASNKYMALNTDTSIVDYLKSSNQGSSFSDRAKLAVDLGVVKDPTQYTGSAAQNTSLLTKAKTATPKTAASVANAGQSAEEYINANQNQDIAGASASDEPPTRTEMPTVVASNPLVEAFQTATGKESIVPTSSAPTAPNFEKTFSELRQQYKVTDLESSVNSLDAQIQDLTAQKRESVNAELGKPVALNVIEGRVSEQERNFNERIDFLDRQKARAINELTAANDTIENIMNLRKMDYDVAKDTYDTEFSNNIQLFNTIRGAVEYEASEEERAADNARSNLQIIYNSIQDGGTDITNIDASTKSKINALEIKAGLPQNFYENLAVNQPDTKVLSTTTRTVGGVKYADVVYQHADGSLSAESVRIGASSSGSGSGSTVNGANPTGEPEVSWEEYLSASENELGMSLLPGTPVYDELQRQWKVDYPATSNVKFTNEEIKKLEQGGMLGKSRQEQLDYLYGDEEDDDNPFS